MNNKIIDATLPKFLLVGVINTLFGCGLMFILYNFAGCSYWLSSAANYVLGGTVSFFLNKYFTFKARAWSWHQVYRFIVTVAICYFIAYSLAKPLVIYLLIDLDIKLQENIAMLVGMFLYTGLNYWGQKLFAFK